MSIGATRNGKRMVPVLVLRSHPDSFESTFVVNATRKESEMKTSKVIVGWSPSWPILGLWLFGLLVTMCCLIGALFLLSTGMP